MTKKSLLKILENNVIESLMLYKVYISSLSTKSYSTVQNQVLSIQKWLEMITLKSFVEQRA